MDQRHFSRECYWKGTFLGSGLMWRMTCFLPHAGEQRAESAEGCSLKGSFRVVRDTRGCHPLLQGIVTTSYKGEGNVLKLVIVMVAQLWEQTKNHWTVHFKWGDYAGYVLYLNKAIVLKKKTVLVRLSQGCHLFLKPRLSYLCPILIIKSSHLCNIFIKAVQM